MREAPSAGAVIGAKRTLARFFRNLGRLGPPFRLLKETLDQPNMRHLIRAGVVGLLALVAGWMADPVAAQSPAAATADGATVAADPWPRAVHLGTDTATLYQPQVENWEGNRLRFRAVVAIAPPGGERNDVGVLWASAITHVDRVSRLVTLDQWNILRTTFSPPGGEVAAMLEALRARLESMPQVIALDRLQASLSLVRDFAPGSVSVQNIPPQIYVSDSPAVLVSISGAPEFRAVARTPFERVINTRALILRDTRRYYLRLYGGWMTADSLEGSWAPAVDHPSGIDRIAEDLASAGHVDLLDSAALQSRPSLGNAAPTVYVSRVPAELIVFDGPPDLQPVPGTALLRATNTDAQLIVDIVSGQYYALISGRWFRSPRLSGPWGLVAARALPVDFSKIPPWDPAGAVLLAVPGTLQAREAMIESVIPQTATVPRANGPTFKSDIDGHPQYRPVAGTPLNYVINSPTPIIRVDSRCYYALQAGIWFQAPSVTGPWAVAASVPAVIYAIPPRAPLHFVTYVKVFETTPEVVQVGYTAGYTGTVLTPEGIAVYGTGYVYPPWIGDRYFPAPVTYGAAVRPLYSVAAAAAFGFVTGAGRASTRAPASHDSAQAQGGYDSRSACCYPDVIQNVYGYWGGSVYTGSRSHPQRIVTDNFTSRGKGRGVTPMRRLNGPTVSLGNEVNDPNVMSREFFAAAPASNDHYADPTGKVYRSTERGWEKRTSGGWERVKGDEASWANGEQQARIAGVERFKGYHALVGADRARMLGAGDVYRSVESGLEVGLRGRRGGP